MKKQMVSDFQTHLEAASGHGVQARTFSEMFTTKEISRLGFDQKKIAELDAQAKWVNASLNANKASTPLPSRLPDLPPPDRLSDTKFFDTRKPFMPNWPDGAVAEEQLRHLIRVPHLPQPLTIIHGVLPIDRSMTKPTLPTIKPGGILFCPELEIVADASGMTAAKAEKAVAAVSGKAGGEFRFEEQQYIAAKAPGLPSCFK